MKIMRMRRTKIIRMVMIKMANVDDDGMREQDNDGFDNWD